MRRVWEVKIDVDSTTLKQTQHQIKLVLYPNWTLGLLGILLEIIKIPNVFSKLKSVFNIVKEGCGLKSSSVIAKWVVCLMTLFSSKLALLLIFIVFDPSHIIVSWWDNQIDKKMNINQCQHKKFVYWHKPNFLLAK